MGRNPTRTARLLESLIVGLHQKKIIFAKTKENPQRSYRVIHQVREEHMLALSCIVVQCAVTKTKIIFSSKQKFFSVLMNNPVDLIYR